MNYLILVLYFSFTFLFCNKRIILMLACAY
uniref:Uncharacterized protein n=1 Tax=Rhizophora mucronata TaxID=61149 RepID=A0A2P2II99_RHIMU